jgi:DNA-binding response OmpR family regulator
MLPTPIILIIHPAEKDHGYGQILEKTGSKVHIVASLQQANELLSFLHPDLIILSTTMPDGEGHIYGQQIRATLVQPRPVLVLLQNSSDISERISLFRFGADDVLQDGIDKKELAFRVMAHLRRRQEEFSNSLTQLPGPNLIRRMLEQSLVSDKPWSAISVDLNKIRVYNETYGDLAGDQLIKALGAILVDIADEKDFVGHIEADDFLLITKSKYPEKKAERICQQFDHISNRFYPRGDIERGYLISTGRGGIRRRIPLISIAVGIVSSSSRRFQSYVDVLTTSRDYRYLAKKQSGSSWVSDGSFLQEEKAPAHNTNIDGKKASRILVIEPDGAMACLLQETLSLEGYFVQVTNSADEAFELINGEGRPDLILMESNLVDRQMDGWKLCRSLKDNEQLREICLIMVTSHPDQSLALEAGADLYLPKPFDMSILINEVSLLLR